MITVDAVTTEILRREGWPAITDRPADRGGLTKGGVTAAALGRWRGLPRAATRDELAALTEAEARQIFVTWYYDAPRYQRLGDPAVEALLYDTTVTSGGHLAVTLLQRVLNERQPPGPLRRVLAIDGALGHTTLAVWQTTDRAGVYSALLKARVRFMLGLALHDPAVRAFLVTHPQSQLHNAAGWINRCLEFLA